ncbi:MAG: hypothetical protein ACREJ4_05690 [Candidatus Methylomirabilaceae bacterium]
MVGSRWDRGGVAFLLLIAAAAGCVRGRGAESDPLPETEWSLTVTNRHWLDVNIQVITDGQRARVGAVPAAGAATAWSAPDGRSGSRPTRSDHRLA